MGPLDMFQGFLRHDLISAAEAGNFMDALDRLEFTALS